MPPLKVCDSCGRESRKGRRDLRRDHGWTFKDVGFGNEIATCGDCNQKAKVDGGTHYTFRRHPR